MSIQSQAHELIDQLPEDAQWDDLVKQLYKHRKITFGMTEQEMQQNDLSDADLNTIIARLTSASSQPSDMRNTKTYNPGNAVTLGMIAGVIAILFSFVFPPIAWAAAVVALVSGGYGLLQKEEKSWIPLLLAGISLVPILSII